MAAASRAQTPREKVRGEAAYVDDMYLPGMLHGAIATSPYPHARIVSYDLEQALAVPASGQSSPAMILI